MYRRNVAGVVKVRLVEIDASEVDQPYGTEARYVLCAMICGCHADIEPRGTSYDRVVGLIRVHGIDTRKVIVRAEAA